MSRFEVIAGGFVEDHSSDHRFVADDESVTIDGEEFVFSEVESVLDAPLNNQGLFECPSCSSVWFTTAVMFDEDTDVVAFRLSSIQCAQCGTEIGTRPERVLVPVEDQTCEEESLDGQPS